MREQRTEPRRGDEAARRERAWAGGQAPASLAPAPEAGALLHGFDAALARRARAEATRARNGRCLADFSARSVPARPDRSRSRSSTPTWRTGRRASWPGTGARLPLRTTAVR